MRLASASPSRYPFPAFGLSHLQAHLAPAPAPLLSVILRNPVLSAQIPSQGALTMLPGLLAQVLNRALLCSPHCVCYSLKNVLSANPIPSIFSECSKCHELKCMLLKFSIVSTCLPQCLPH